MTNVIISILLLVFSAGCIGTAFLLIATTEVRERRKQLARVMNEEYRREKFLKN